MTTPSKALPFEWVGGRLCLDFTNTKSWDGHEHTEERFNEFRDVERWAREASVLAKPEAAAVARAAAHDEDAALMALSEALAVRSLIHSVFTPIARDELPPQRWVEALNVRARRAQGHSVLYPADGTTGRWRRTWSTKSDDLRQVVRPVVVDAIELLLTPDLVRLRTCANERCGWLFLDQSRNGMRRWCDMKVCGNRAKMRRHYARTATGG